jgi:hypothetical protein
MWWKDDNELHVGIWKDTLLAYLKEKPRNTTTITSQNKRECDWVLNPRPLDYTYSVLSPDWSDSVYNIDI